MLLYQCVQYMHQLVQIFWGFMRCLNNTVEKIFKKAQFSKNSLHFDEICVFHLTYIAGCGFACIISLIYKYT